MVDPNLRKVAEEDSHLVADTVVVRTEVIKEQLVLVIATIEEQLATATDWLMLCSVNSVKG